MAVSFEENGKAVYVGPKVCHVCDVLSISCCVHLSGQVAHRFMDFANWLLAWDRYAIAADMLKQVGFRDAMQYKAVCTEVRCVTVC